MRKKDGLQINRGSEPQTGAARADEFASALNQVQAAIPILADGLQTQILPAIQGLVDFFHTPAGQLIIDAVLQAEDASAIVLGGMPEEDDGRR